MAQGRKGVKIKMANEKAKEVKAVETNEIATTTEATTAIEANGKVFPVTRQPFTGKDGKEYWGYVVKGTIVRVKNNKRFEKEVTVDFVAKDQGGYEVLDLIFFDTDEAELRIHDETMTNDKTGEISTYTVYEVCATDDDGTVYSYKVKPSRESDKALLTMLLNSHNVGGAQ